MNFVHWYEGSDDSVAYTKRNQFAENATITLNAKFAAKQNSELEGEISVVIGETVTDDGAVSSAVISDNKFITLSTNETISLDPDNAANRLAYVTGKSTKFGTGADEVTLTQALRMANTANGADTKSFYIKAKENINLVAYLSVAGTNGTDTRISAIKYKKNGGDAVVVAQCTERKLLTGVLSISLSAGDEIEIYASIASNSSGARLFLYGVEAELDSAHFTNVTVKFHKADGNVQTVGWNTLKTNAQLVAALGGMTDTNADGDAFLGWSLNSGATQPDDYTAYPALNAGAVVDLYPVFASADVTVKFYTKNASGEYVQNGTDLKKASATQTILATDAPTVSETNLVVVGWCTKSGDVYTDYTFDTVLTANATVELYAKYAAVLSVSGTSEFDTVKNPATVSAKVTTETAIGSSGKIAHKGERTPTAALTEAVASGTKNGYTYGPYAVGDNVIATSSNCNKDHYIALNLVEGHTYRVIIVWSVTGTTARHVAVMDSFDKPTDTQVSGAKKADGMQVNNSVVTAASGKSYYVGFDNKEVYIYEIKVLEIVNENKQITGLSGTVEESEGNLDLSKLSLVYDGGTVALNDSSVSALVNVDSYSVADGTVTVTVAGKAVYTYTVPTT